VNRGSVVRITLVDSSSLAPKVIGATVIGSGFSERTDPGALVIGPTGVALSPACGSIDDDECSLAAILNPERVLYVADTLNNRIAAIPNPFLRFSSAGTGVVVSANGSLNGPLGIAVSPNGRIFAVNSGDGLMTEITPHGAQIAKRLLDYTAPIPTGGAGALFGLIVTDDGKAIYFVDDISNTLNVIQ
jgi:DNA-binding beta-propeller fold protein YncE